MSLDLTHPLLTLAEVQSFFDQYARVSRAGTEQRSSAEGRWRRMRKLLTKLGDPQNKLRVIHIAGTTGKGSTCTYIDALLRAHGFTTGLCLSPHVSDVRERFQLNGKLISEARCVRLANEVRAAAHFMQEEVAEDLPAYCEFLRAMTYLLFAQERVQYAVVETGIGGRFDSSNMVERSDKFCVITKLGLDHVKTLGDTVEKIAQQKIGIVQPGNEVVIAPQTLIDQEQLVSLAQTEGAARVRLVSDADQLGEAVQGLVAYLRENASVAAVTVRQLALRDGWVYRSELVREALVNAILPLRFELFPWHGKTLILDAAHNPQKIQGLADALSERFPHQAYAVVLAFNPGTEIGETAQPIILRAQTIVCADFVAGQGEYQFRFMDPFQITTALMQTNPTCAPHVLTEWAALEAWLKATPDSLIVVAGSFHFVANVRTKLLGTFNPE